MSGVVGGEDDELDDGDATPDLDDDQRPRRPLRRCHPMMRSRPPCWRSPPVLLSGEKYTYNQLQNNMASSVILFIVQCQTRWERKRGLSHSQIVFRDWYPYFFTNSSPPAAALRVVLPSDLYLKELHPIIL